ncbi:preprotein translocase subunit SecY [Candidatus Peregrinibacteria bacterium]|nr:preprotein translocase subunit SecY [Candidatus Peregrinibacteria bacterium]
MLKYLQQIWNSKDLRSKILFTLGILVIYRLISQISIPGANIDAISRIFEQNQLLGTFSMLTGGSAQNFSIILMGLSPYINASIIVQLLTVIVPSLENLSKEGMEGRKKLNTYTRLLTVPIAFIQSYGMILLLNSQSQIPIVENVGSLTTLIPIMITVTAGTLLLMWLGELITEYGISNGISILIFASIISSVPQIVSQNLALAQESTQFLIPFVIMFLITIILIVFVVIVTEGERRIPILYATRGAKSGSTKSNLPIRVNQAGMIPIIFSLSVVSVPGILAQFMQGSDNATLRTISDWILSNFSVNSIWYSLFYFFLVIGFTYFYVSITFNPEQVAETVQKRGGYIPGIRPGKQTAEYLGKVSNRLNLWGGLFIAFLAISPSLISLLSSSLSIGAIPILIGGAGMIIVVSVVLDIVRKVNAQMVMHDYNKLY